jgi:transposase InsO family protein
MQLRLHANATTTPRIRAYIQKSTAATEALARELGIHRRTVARWKARQDVADRSTRPHRLATTISAWEEALILELRRSLALPLDDIVEAMRRCLNPQLSRSAIHRCLKRHNLSARLTPDKAPAAAFQTDTPAGFIHVDVKYLPPLGRRRSYAYVVIDRATRFVYLEILPDRRAATAAGFLARFLDRFPLKVHTVLTDNGSEFTDRFAVDKKGKPHDKPSGTHAFDRLCAARAITHRLTRPFRPQSNGMVERFNRRLGEHRPHAAKPSRPSPPLCRSCRTRRLPPHLRRRLQSHPSAMPRLSGPPSSSPNSRGHNTDAGGSRSHRAQTVALSLMWPAAFSGSVGLPQRG